MIIQSNFFHHVGCAFNLHSIFSSGLIPGGQSLSKRQTVFFLLIDPRDKVHKDPEMIDLNIPRHAQYLHNAWKKHQDAVKWVDINLAISKGLTFYQTKRVRFTESRGRKRQGEDVEDLASKAEEQHLDADVEVLAHKTWRVEDVVGDAADAAPEQTNILLDAREQSMNSLVQSKTEVFEQIEESLRQLCMVEDLNDDEVMELCILSNELNACETTAILNPSKFAPYAMRLGLREGFAVDLTTARANGAMWDFSLEDDRAELRRVQNREQPELLARSPPSDEFSSLLNTCVEAREVCKLRTEKIEPQIRAYEESYKLQMEMRRHFVHEHPEVSSSWEMLEVQSLINDPRVYSIDGPMCRWSLRTRGLKNKTEFMRKRTRWLTSSKEIAEVLSGDGRWKRDKRFVHMTGKSETVSEYPASLVVAMLKAIKRQMISDGVIRIEEMHFAGPVPDEGDNPTELEGKCGVDGTWIDPKLLIVDGRRKWST